MRTMTRASARDFHNGRFVAVASVLCATGLVSGGTLGCGEDAKSEASQGGEGGGAAAGGAGTVTAMAGTGGTSSTPQASRTGLVEADCVARPNATHEWFPDTDRCEVVCAAGFADCDGQQDNGCEVSTSDAAACGRCIDACLSDLCGGAPACAAVQADLWSASGGYGDITDLTVNDAGQVFVNLTVGLPNETIPAIGALSVVALSGGVRDWVSVPGQSGFQVVGPTKAQVEATPVGVYMAEAYSGIVTLATEVIPEPEGGDILLSLFSFGGERLWSRPLGISTNASVFGLHADEDSNVYVEILTDEEFVYEDVTIDAPLVYANILLSFTPSGDFRWAKEVSPYSLHAVSGGQFVSESIFGDAWRSAETGEPAPGVPFQAVGGRGILHDAAGNLIVVGSTQSSQLHLQGGFPGLSDVSSDEGVEGANRNAIFAAKYAPDGQLLWRTGFGHSLGYSELWDVRLAADDTLYMMASGTARSETNALIAMELARVFVARIGADGSQQGAWRLDVDDPAALGLSVSATGLVNVGIHFDGAAQLPEPLTGTGVVGGTLQFPAP